MSSTSTRRLSPWRVLLAVVIVTALTAGVYTGWQWWKADRSVASSQRWFAGYVDVTDVPAVTFEAPAHESEKSVVLSFIVAAEDNPCEPTWGTYYTLDEAAEKIDLDRRLARLQQLGGSATVSFGGLLNSELATGCTSETRLAAAYETVLDRYNTNTIDLDIEGEALSDSAAGERRAAAIQRVQAARQSEGAELEVWLTLPVSPAGLTVEGTAAVAQMLSAGVNLAGVNAMTMDYGHSRNNSDTMAETSITALTSVHDQLRTIYAAEITRTERLGIDPTPTGFVATAPTSAELWVKIGATPMIGQNDVAGEIFTLDDARELNAFALQKKLGRMSMWSLGRDATCGPNYADLTKVSGHCSGIDQGDEFYSEILANSFSSIQSPASKSTSAPSGDTTDGNITEGDVGEGDVGEPSQPNQQVIDDPATSPYEVWSADSVYQKATKVVWHGNVYESKIWTKGDVPDDPSLTEFETTWSLIGPVLPGDKPMIPIILPIGTYPDWDPTTVYRSADRVLLDGVPYEAKWWTQSDRPGESVAVAEDSAWRILTAAEVAAVLGE